MSRRRTPSLLIAVGGLLALGLVVSGALSGTSSPAYAATTAGCGKAPTLTSGTRTIQSSGQNRTYILRIPDNYDSNRPYRLIFALPLAERHRQRRRLGRNRRGRLGLLRAAATVEQQHDLRRAAGPRQRLGQHQRSGPDLRRRHDQADRGRPVRRHDAASSPWASATAAP